MNLETNVGPLRLPNPILAASGTFGYAKEAAPFVDLAKLGGIVPKTITLAPRKGNHPWRIVETPAGMLNSIGLDNDGLDHFLAHHLPYLRSLDVPIIVNVAGRNPEEFSCLAATVAKEPGVAAVELNLSCPNIAGGTDYGTDPERAALVVRNVRAECALPLLAKLTPNVTDIASIAGAVAEAGADAVTLINTVLGAAVDWRQRKALLSTTFGGLSGPAIKPIALRCVLAVRKRLKIPIVAVGGIRNIDDVLEFLVAGASAAQVGTANFFDPPVTQRLVEQLPAALAEAGVSSVAELVGSIREQQ